MVRVSHNSVKVLFFFLANRLVFINCSLFDIGCVSGHNCSQGVKVGGHGGQVFGWTANVIGSWQVYELLFWSCFFNNYTLDGQIFWLTSTSKYNLMSMYVYKDVQSILI